MANPLNTKVNGHCYDYSSLKATSDVATLPIIERITEINYEHSLEVGELRGRGAGIYGTTRGQYSTQGSMTIYKEDWDLFRSGLIALPTPPGGGFMEKRFNFQIIYGEFGSNTVVDVLSTVRVVGVQHSRARGTDALMVALTLHIQQIFENGDPAFIDGSGLPSLGV
jgi:hypothetical protein